MDHELFGKLKHKDEFWRGWATLPAFAAVGKRADDEPPTEAEAGQLAVDAMARMRERMRAEFGDVAARMFEAGFQSAMNEPAEDEQPDPEVQAREQERLAREQRPTARLARGEFPFRIKDPNAEGPTQQQAAAFRHLVTSTDAVFAAVSGAVFESFQSAYADEYWRSISRLKPANSLADLAGQYAILWVEIYREHHNGTAYLVFPLDASWEDDHGLLVVYHRDKPTAWTMYDGLDELIESGG